MCAHACVRACVHVCVCVRGLGVVVGRGEEGGRGGGKKGKTGGPKGGGKPICLCMLTRACLFAYLSMYVSVQVGACACASDFACFTAKVKFCSKYTYE